MEHSYLNTYLLVATNRDVPKRTTARDFTVCGTSVYNFVVRMNEND